MLNYEVPSRLADSEQQAQVRSILGLENESLNNVEPMAEPERVGAGRARRFAAPAAFVGSSTNNTSNAGEGNRQRHSQQVGSGRPHQPGQDAASGNRNQPAIATLRQAAGTGALNVDVEMMEPPRRVAGYADLAKFIASDKVFCIFRRFESLSARNLLYMQDEICELEERLRVVDEADLRSGDPAAWYSLHSRRDDKNVERGEIMRQVREKLCRYQKSLYMHSQCVKMEKARDMYVESVRNWVDGKKPVVEEESHFLDDQNDLASLGLRGDEYHFFEKWVEKHFSHVFESNRHRKRPLYGAEVQYYSATSIRRVVRSMLTIFAVAVLVGPLFALHYAKKQVLRLALIAVFSLVFALAVSLATKSRNFEIFAATAAYAAVLAVFVGNNSAG